MGGKRKKQEKKKKESRKKWIWFCFPTTLPLPWKAFKWYHPKAENKAAIHTQTKKEIRRCTCFWNLPRCTSDRALLCLFPSCVDFEGGCWMSCFSPTSGSWKTASFMSTHVHRSQRGNRSAHLILDYLQSIALLDKNFILIEVTGSQCSRKFKRWSAKVGGEKKSQFQRSKTSHTTFISFQGKQNLKWFSR